MKTWLTIAAMCVIAVCAPVFAQDAAKDDSADLAAIAQGLLPCLVQVEYTLQYDKGEPPRFGGQFISQERPLEMGGCVLAPDLVLTPDIKLHSRFIKSIAVRLGEQSVAATIDRVALDEDGAILKLEKPLGGAKPLAFDAKKEKPYYSVWQSRSEGLWCTHANAAGESVTVRPDGQKLTHAPRGSIVVDKKGSPVGATMNGDLPLDGSWKGSPLEWKWMTSAQLKSATESLEKKIDAGLLRVRLTFRSPRKEAADPYRSGSVGGDEAGGTLANVPGVLVGDKRVLILALLKPRQTARLESITVFAGGKEAPARFEASLTDYGALTATLDSPLPGALTLADGPITQCLDQLLMACDLRIQGENRVQYVEHGRFNDFDLGWKQHVYPNSSHGDKCFFFDTQGRLLALPIARREKATEEQRSYSYSSESSNLTPVADIGAALADLAKNSDAQNVPLTEEQESRLAWIGVELQPLDRELARANKVSDLTQDGQTGAIVSYVYDGSPAQKAGIKVGDVLLRLHVEGFPKPMSITVDGPSFRGPFPWHRYDELPESLFDRVPRPWPAVENSFIRALTDLGFGKKFEIELFRDAQVQRLAMTVEQSPPHYDTAGRFKSKEMGLTVQDLTYETRRYFQKTDKDPGVILAKVEPGSKASVAGLKPFEIITHVNGQPVIDAKAFEKLIATDARELRLEVKRMTQGRVVVIRTDARPTTDSRPAPSQPAGGEPEP